MTKMPIRAIQAARSPVTATSSYRIGAAIAQRPTGNASHLRTRLVSPTGTLSHSDGGISLAFKNGQAGLQPAPLKRWNGRVLTAAVVRPASSPTGA